MLFIPGGQMCEAWEPLERNALDLYVMVDTFTLFHSSKSLTQFGMGVIRVSHTQLHMPADT
jgi:hypothetical protein